MCTVVTSPTVKDKVEEVVGWHFGKNCQEISFCRSKCEQTLEWDGLASKESLDTRTSDELWTEDMRVTISDTDSGNQDGSYVNG